jgi:hypothetical protein
MGTSPTDVVGSVYLIWFMHCVLNSDSLVPIFKFSSLFPPKEICGPRICWGALACCIAASGKQGLGRKGLAVCLQGK